MFGRPGPDRGQRHEPLALRQLRMTMRTLLRTTALSFAATAVVVGGHVAPAHAAQAPITGSTAWSDCGDWFTSNNVRYTSVANKRVRVKLSSTGKLGVKMRTKSVNTGDTSATRYYPPLDKWQDMGKFAKKNAPFRLQFSCQNARKWNERPNTEFEGTLDS